MEGYFQRERWENSLGGAERGERNQPKKRKGKRCRAGRQALALLAGYSGDEEGEEPEDDGCQGADVAGKEVDSLKLIVIERDQAVAGGVHPALSKGGQGDGIPVAEQEEGAGDAGQGQPLQPSLEPERRRV